MFYCIWYEAESDVASIAHSKAKSDVESIFEIAPQPYRYVVEHESDLQHVPLKVLLATYRTLNPNGAVIDRWKTRSLAHRKVYNAMSNDVKNAAAEMAKEAAQKKAAEAKAKAEAKAAEKAASKPVAAEVTPEDKAKAEAAAKEKAEAAEKKKQEAADKKAAKEKDKADRKAKKEAEKEERAKNRGTVSADKRVIRVVAGAPAPSFKGNRALIYAEIKDGMTVAEFVSKVKDAPLNGGIGDIGIYLVKGLISLEPEAAEPTPSAEAA